MSRTGRTGRNGSPRTAPISAWSTASARAARSTSRGRTYRVDIMAERGLYDDAKKGKFRCSDPHLRLKDMEADGVDAEVIYGVLGTASKLNDKEASNEVLRIYNDWLKDFCSHYPGPPDRPRLPALWQRRRRGEGGPPRRQDGAHAASNCRARGTWSRCGTRAGSRCGRRSTRSICRCISTPSRRPRRAPARRRRRSAARRCSPASRRSRWASSTSSRG